MSDYPVSRPRHERFGALTTSLPVLGALVLMPPVVLLPVTTALPPVAWVLLLVADLALIAWLIARRRRRRVRPLAVGGVALLAGGAVFASHEIMGEPRLSLVVPIVPFLAPEYGLVDKVNHIRGLIDSFTAAPWGSSWT